MTTKALPDVKLSCGRETRKGGSVVQWANIRAILPCMFILL